MAVHRNGTLCVYSEGVREGVEEEGVEASALHSPLTLLLNGTCEACLKSTQGRTAVQE